MISHHCFGWIVLWGWERIMHLSGWLLNNLLSYGNKFCPEILWWIYQIHQHKKFIVSWGSRSLLLLAHFSEARKNYPHHVDCWIGASRIICQPQSTKLHSGALITHWLEKGRKWLWNVIEMCSKKKWEKILSHTCLSSPLTWKSL